MSIGDGLSVPCLKCLVDAGEPCVGIYDGKLRWRPHQVRVDYEAGDPEAVERYRDAAAEDMP